MITTTLLLLAFSGQEARGADADIHARSRAGEGIVDESRVERTRAAFAAEQDSAESGTLLRLYEVRDLSFDDPGAEEGDEQTFGPLLELLQRDLTLAEPTEAMRLNKGTLVCNLSAAKHERVEELLAFQRESRVRQILIETRIFEGDSFTVDGEPLLGTRILEKGERLDVSGGATIVNAPKVITLPARNVSMFTGNEIPYIARYEVVEHVQPGDRRVEVPVIEIVASGMSLRARAHWVEEGHIEVRMEVEHSELLRFQAGVDSGSDRAIDLPVVQSRSFLAHAILQEDQGLFVMGDPDGEGPIGVHLSVRGITPEPDSDSPPHRSDPSTEVDRERRPY